MKYNATRYLPLVLVGALTGCSTIADTLVPEFELPMACDTGQGYTTTILPEAIPREEGRPAIEYSPLVIPFVDTTQFYTKGE